MIIIDASVIFKWLVDEDPITTSKAREILIKVLKGEEILVPDILLYEIGNILTFQLKLDEKDIDDAWDSFLEYPIKFYYPDTKFMNQCLKFSKKYGITIYDASYIVLAYLKNSQFITADQKLVNKVNLPYVKYLVN